MAKYIYGNTLTPFTTARANDVKAEFQSLETVTATEEQRTDEAIKLPAGSGDQRLTETPAQRADKALGFDAGGALYLYTNPDAAILLAQDWASKTTGLVDATDYSAKAWAIGSMPLWQPIQLFRNSRLSPPGLRLTSWRMRSGTRLTS